MRLTGEMARDLATKSRHAPITLEASRNGNADGVRSMRCGDMRASAIAAYRSCKLTALSRVRDRTAGFGVCAARG